MKTGIVDVGGGLRGVYAAGVFDYCMDQEILFDLCIGVSAGSANAAAYIAGQARRNYTFYTEYPFRKEYMSIRNFLCKHSYIDLDYIYGTLSNSTGENPLDYQAIMQSPIEYIAVATNAKTGEAKYFGKYDLHQDDYSVLKASSAIPFLCHPYAVNGTLCFDGALGNAVPVDLVFALGCDRVVLILTKPRDLIRVPGMDMKFAKQIEREYPRSADKLRRRAQLYNRGVAQARKLEAEGRVLIVAPDDTCGVDTLTKNRDALKQLYEKGYQDAKKIPAFLIQ